MHPDLPQQLHRYAIEAMKAGKLAAADLALRHVLDFEPDNAPVLHLLGVLAARVGAREASISYFQQAQALEPDNASIRENLRVAESLEAPVMPAGDRYLLIKSWGFGFWADVSQVIGSLLLAEATGRIPVTHWGSNSLFGDKSERDAFGFYFEPISPVPFEALAKIEPASFFPPRWHKDNLTENSIAKWEGKGSRAGAVYFLNRPETIAVSDFMIGMAEVAPWLPSSHPLHGKPLADIYRQLLALYLRPRPDIVAERDSFLERHLKNRPFVALHMRGSDKRKEDPNLEGTHAALVGALDAVDRSWPILLLTDDARCLARMRERYGARLLVTDCQRTATGEGVHCLSATNPVRAGREVLIDALLALKAHHFIGSGHSNVSAMIALMKDPGSCTLIGNSMLLERNLHVHQIPAFESAAGESARAGS
jgi:protein O-GlcNAc transferase